MTKITLRCAIYTRKSTEEGLDQEFNSLDAQREACTAFINSQVGQGWKALPKLYDDGGISGGTMVRPALHELLADINAGKIDVVVVYKIDRLTRSLMDFAKIVEVFDKHKVSFVSVTQQFNTLSSMGRLTLNVLLSFAQFEREVTAERIRDKFAASRSKGMWMGGPTPLGYIVRDKKLLVHPEEAETIKKIYSLYEQLSSVRKLKEHLDQLGLMSKLRVRNDGTPTGGKLFGRGQLQWILTNPIYAGLTSHKGKLSEGQHEAIIARDTWNSIQSFLANRAPRQRMHLAGELKKSPAVTQNTALLAGIIYDETDDRLTPSHANKAGVRYRYYVSMRLLHEGKKDTSGWRLPAKTLEELVLKQLDLLLRDHKQLHSILNLTNVNIQDLEKTMASVASLCLGVACDNYSKVRAILCEIVDRIVVAPGLLTITLNRKKLASLLNVQLNDSDIDSDCYCLSVPFSFKRRGKEPKIIIGDEVEAQKFFDEALINTIRNAHRWMRQLQSAQSSTVVEIAKSESLDDGEISRVLPLAFLAPDIVEAILEGRQPLALTARVLKRLKPLPLSWIEQRQILGFPSKI